MGHFSSHLHSHPTPTSLSWGKNVWATIYLHQQSRARVFVAGVTAPRVVPALCRPASLSHCLADCLSSLLHSTMLAATGATCLAQAQLNLPQPQLACILQGRAAAVALIRALHQRAAAAAGRVSPGGAAGAGPAQGLRAAAGTAGALLLHALLPGVPRSASSHQGGAGEVEALLRLTGKRCLRDGASG